MATDTSRTLQIAGSPGKLIGLVAIGVVMTAASVAVAIVPEMGAGLVGTVVGWVGAVFFGLCTIVALGRLLRAREPVLTISPQGIRDTRIAEDVIPWTAITKISTWGAFNQKAMVLAVDPATEAKLHLTAMARSTRGANRALGADGLCIVAAGLKIDFPSLLETSVDYWTAARDRL